MPKRTDIKKILVIGSGPIVIGQAAEFDYAGTQACLALKEEGYKVVLINSNPATIMTDTIIADKVYMEPLNLEFVSRIIRMERPDALLPTLGGQTALNLAVQLYEKGILAECRVEVIGTSIDSIEHGEDRDLFKKLCERISQPVLESFIATNKKEAIQYANQIGYPIIVRPGYTLGGTGGGFADNDAQLLYLVDNALSLSSNNTVLIEKSIKGYKEIEFECMRDHKGTTITICCMENIDPVGVHTGDSMVVCPSQTLASKEYNMLKQASIKIIQALDIIGGCNIQFALDPNSFDYYVIEVNPRVSRSSALASKASGYPIARVSSKIAVGLNLDEIDLSCTKACFEPSLDYIVVKLPRFPFDKFVKANRNLSTQMKATGEVMSVGRTFEEAFLKGIRSLEIGVNHIYLKKMADKSTEDLLKKIEKPTDEGIFVIAELLRRDISVRQINSVTKIDAYFLDKIKLIIDFEKVFKADPSLDNIKKAKRMGFSDAYLAEVMGMDEIEFFLLRKENNIFPVYHMIDTCAGEFDSYVPYLYSTYESFNESIVTEKEKVIVLGSGPIRIGQGVEFDYSTVHAIWGIKEMGYEAIVINNNPETVSTDYLISDKLYFEALTIEDVMNIITLEKPKGVIVELGGQTAINLAERLDRLNIPIIGSDPKAIERAENRKSFEALVRELKIPQPKGKTVNNMADGIKTAEEIGYPVLVRPSYVLGGRAMQIVYENEGLVRYLNEAFLVDSKQPVLIDKYVSGKEAEVDAVCDGVDVFIPGIMEHIERTGVHSGDSISVYPPVSLSDKVKEKICEYTIKLGLEIGIVGLFNIQFIVEKNDQVSVIEVNPRSSRTVPFISKATKVNLANIATKVMLGKSLKEQGFTTCLLEKESIYYVKAPTFSYSKIGGLDAVLSPEMKSTGEAIGYDSSLNRALYKALKASNQKVINYGTVFVTVSDKTKEEALPLVRRFYELGFNIVATRGTGMFLKEHGIKTRVMKKISENSEEILEEIRKGYISYIINTVSSYDDSGTRDGAIIRKVAVENNITPFTSLDTVRVLLDVLDEITMKVRTI
ncbi:MAG: carbamoyl-phosphate synthase large subunit [Bacilli bacterium]|jgi:carbamoyl-phosphate synthase large subunit